MSHLNRAVKRLSLKANDIVLFERAADKTIMERDLLRNMIFRMAAQRGIKNVGVVFLDGDLRVRKMPSKVRMEK